MEDFLPILIGIVWLVYTLYNRAQKKKNAGRPQQAEKKENRSPSFIEQLLMGEEPAQPQPYETYEKFDETEPDKIEFDEEFPVKEKPTPFLKKELSDFVYEGQSSTYNENILENAVDEIQSETKTEADDFDLRKAIIYSEILNAPYIVYK